MKIFFYKTLLIFGFLLLFYHQTIGSKIRELESKFDNIKSKDNLTQIKIKIRKEMQSAVKKENYIETEDAILIRKFLDKIKKELNY